MQKRESQWDTVYFVKVVFEKYFMVDKHKCSLSGKNPFFFNAGPGIMHQGNSNIYMMTKQKN